MSFRTKQEQFFYIGVTNDLARRIYEHKQQLVDGFSRKYKLKYLMYFETFQNAIEAISREKQLKNWHRDWKLNLIKEVNPQMMDLFPDILGGKIRDAETSSA